MKIQSQPESRELFYLVGMFRTQPGRQHLRSSKKTAPRSQEGKSGFIQVCNKGSRQSEHQRSGIKLRKLVFCVWEDVSLWAHWIHYFNLRLSYLGPNPISLFSLRSGRCVRELLLAFPCPLFTTPPVPQQSAWVSVACSGSQFWESSFTFGGQK